MGEWARLTIPRELDANAKAVEILARVNGWPEVVALQVMAAYLAAAYAAQRRGQQIPVGHPSACEELRDLLHRFSGPEVPGVPAECRPP